MRSESALRTDLGKFHDERTRSYEVDLSRFAIRHCDTDSIQALTNIARDTGSCTEDVRYTAFYALNIIFRNLDDYAKLDSLMEEFADDFSDHPTFSHLELLSKLDRGDFSNPYALLANARSDAERFKRNAGFAHLYADLFATIYESHRVTDTEKYLDKWYQSALAAAMQAIQLDPAYAKFYCTRGRILAIGGQFDKADRDVQTAISLEDSSRPDYAVRLQRYYYYKLKFDSGREIASLTERVNKLEQELAALTSGKDADGNKGPEPLTNVEPYDGLLPYAFLSYSHKDTAPVFNLIAKLQQLGARIWFDKGIPKGEGWEEELVARIDDSDVVLFCLSGNTKISQEVSKECSLAAGAKKQLVCVDFEPDCLGNSQRYQLERLQHIMSYELGEEQTIDAIFDALPSSVKGGA